MDSFVDMKSEFRNYLYGTNFENITFKLTIHAENKIILYISTISTPIIKNY